MDGRGICVRVQYFQWFSVVDQGGGRGGGGGSRKSVLISDWKKYQYLRTAPYGYVELESLFYCDY